MHRLHIALGAALACAAPALAQGAPVEGELPEEKARRQEVLAAREATRAAYELLQSYGRDAPPPAPPPAPGPDDLRDRGRSRLAQPLEPRPRAPQAPPGPERQTPAEALHELEVTRELIRARLSLLAPEKYPPTYDDDESPQEEAEEGLLPPRVIDVRDLVYQPEDHRGTNVGLGVGLDPGGAVAYLEGSEDTPDVGLDAEKLCELLADAVGDEDGSSIEFSAGRILARVRPAAMKRLEGRLAAVRRQRDGLVELEVRVYHMPPEVFAALRRSASIGPEAERALAAAVTQGKATLAASHRLVAHDGQLVNVRRGPSRAFVGDVSVNQTGVVPVLNPVTALLEEGLMIEVRPIVDRARGRAQLDVSASVSRLAGTIETRKVVGIDLELPALDLARVAATTTVPLGEGALLGGVLQGGEGGQLACVFYVRPRLVRSGKEGR